MRSLPLFGLGLAMAFIGVALFVLTWRAPAKPAPAAKKVELRDWEARRAETKKMWIAAGVIAAFGLALLAIS